MMKLLRVASLILIVCAAYSSSSDFKNGTDTIDSQWQQFKVSEIKKMPCYCNQNYSKSNLLNRSILKEIIQPMKT